MLYNISGNFWERDFSPLDLGLGHCHCFSARDASDASTACTGPWECTLLIFLTQKFWSTIFLPFQAILSNFGFLQFWTKFLSNTTNYKSTVPRPGVGSWCIWDNILLSFWQPLSLLLLLFGTCLPWFRGVDEMGIKLWCCTDCTYIVGAVRNL